MVDGLMRLQGKVHHVIVLIVAVYSCAVVLGTCCLLEAISLECRAHALVTDLVRCCLDFGIVI